MKRFGIDVSKWQGNFNFQKAKAEGVEFAILRGAYARTKDTKFESYYSSCKALKIPVGVYHYSMALTPDDGRKEAEFLYKNVLKGKQFELPIYIDVEDKTQLALSKRALTDSVKAWCEYLEERGYFVGIYASKWTFDGELYDSELTRYTHWIAQWSEKCTYNGRFGMWQFGGEKNVLRSNRISNQIVDQNFMYEDFPGMIKRANLNGYGNPGGETKQHTGASDASQPPYNVRVTANLLNYRSGAGANHIIRGQIKKNEIYTIVEEKNGWGKLKSGAGWVNLKYVERT